MIMFVDLVSRSETMKIKLSLIFSFLMILNVSAQSTTIEKVVYGDDSRLDVYQSTNVLYKKFEMSTAALIDESSLVSLDDDTVRIKGRTLQDAGICFDEKFANQILAAECTGFLVGPDLLVTAGHCITQISDCESKVWVFDFANRTEEKSVFDIKKKNIYHCTQIINRTQDEVTMNDYALVKLDRVSDRTPLNFRKSGKISNNSALAVIGHPSGLPSKIADGAFVRKNSNTYFFQANLDTFGGNSGSPVFNAKTGVVEGILVRGEEDYERDILHYCLRPRICKMDGCRGEDVTRITNIAELKSLPK